MVSCPEPLRPPCDAALDRVAVVADLDAAERLVAEHAGVRAVTRAGDVLGRGWAAGGSASSPSALEVQAAVDEADQRAGEAAATFARLEAELAEQRSAPPACRPRWRPPWPR